MIPFDLAPMTSY